MSIFDLNYGNQVPNLLPASKRNPVIIRWLIALLTPTQWLHDITFGIYTNGASYDAWDSGTTYAYQDRVIYSDHAVYEALQAVPAGTLPTNTTYWYKISPNFIGVMERVYYTGVKLTLEWAMNRWFGTTFRQPPSTPDIYIQNNPIRSPVFVVGGLESNSSVVWGASNPTQDYVIDSYSFGIYNNFTIFIPLAVFDALDANPANREPIVRAFVDKYVTAGIAYNIETY